MGKTTFEAPYNIGDRVWHFWETDYEPTVEEYKVVEIIFDRAGRYLVLANENHRAAVEFEEFGDTLFSTKEEAENAINEGWLFK